MRWAITLLVVVGLGGGAAGGVVGLPRNRSRYNFYREMRASATRRVFGGAPFNVTQFPTACALLDRYLSARCSCAVVAARWAVTAAHCVTPRVAYVQYTAVDLSSGTHSEKYAPVDFRYKHPKYKVVVEESMGGPDVTLLQHDVGLVRVRHDLPVLLPRDPTPVDAMRLYNPLEFFDKEIRVLGFGKTDRLAQGEELYTVLLRLAFCARNTWLHCQCAVSAESGVCSGDSGGPVLYRGVQIGVTSMGPVECGGERTRRDVHEPDKVSVFTSLWYYSDMINATIHNSDTAGRMIPISAASAVTLTSLLLALMLLALTMR